jgi:tRNA pseudouridine13 synthase
VKLKQRPADFRVLELLKEGFPAAPGPYHIYRVTKTKRTTLEVLDRLAFEAGVDKRQVSFAGLKDRQGIAMQHFSVEGGKIVRLSEPDLKVEPIGDSDVPVDASASIGNGFDLTLRDLNAADIRCYRRSKETVRDQGVPNYFDDQRFGALRHGQGFVAREMIDGKIESALKRLLLFPSPFDPPREAAFKGRLRRAWGEFEECVKLCRGGKHLSVFEHLARNPHDFAGAFRFVSQRIRLIHLYTYQSYLWNLCVSQYLRGKLPLETQISLPTDMGPVTAFTRLERPLDGSLGLRTFPLLAPDVVIDDPEIRRAVDEVLAREGITLDRLVVKGVEGFAFKPEERPLLVVPRHWRAIRSEPDELNDGAEKLRIRFELPRGSYATMVVKRLFVSTDPPADATPIFGARGARPGARPPAGGPPVIPPRRRSFEPGIRESGGFPDSFGPSGDPKNIDDPVWRPAKPKFGSPGRPGAGGGTGGGMPPRGFPPRGRPGLRGRPRPPRPGGPRSGGPRRGGPRP